MIAPRLLVVADHGFVGDTERWLGLLREAGTAAQGHPVAIQVRAKQANEQELAQLAGLAREVVARDVPLFLNGPQALAEELGYDGVHWPEAAIAGGPSPRPSVLAEPSPRPSPFARERERSVTAVEGREVLLRSAAVHGVAGLRRAELAGVDFVVFGSVFEPGSKPGDGAGVGALAEVTRAAKVPVVAIGGITPERVADCALAGASGVGVVSGVLAAASPGNAVHTYLAAWEAAAGIVTQGEAR